jgi:WD40-like Beta Propeller Repeat
MNARAAIVPLVSVLVASLTLASGARGDVFGPISLMSESPVQQAEYAHDAAISADGRYVAFDGSFGGRTGVWRRNVQSGAVEAVAPGNAERPSISADGRYISFTTTARLTPADTNEGPDVYVRDMEIQSSQPCQAGGEGEASACPFELASAVDGGNEGLAYEASGSEYGSMAAGRTALSADGRKVAFVTTAVSDLIGPRPPQSPTTPAMQVAVRDLDTHSTQLVSVVQPANGGAQPVSEIESEKTLGAVYAAGLIRPPFTAIGAYGSTPEFGASISADGSTVAWLGVNVAKQAPFLAAEAPAPRYAEPLWRRIADGPLAPTMRVTGGSDPLNPACVASGESALPSARSLADPCQGPFDTNPARKDGLGSGTWLMEGNEGNFVPQLSADGYQVAFLANAPLVASGADFERTSYADDIYVSNMNPGLTRMQALRQLSELASGNTTDLTTNAPIVDLAISADGTQVAFSTKRTVFPLGVPTFASQPASVPGMAEMFEADLTNETLTRVSHGFGGEPGEHPFDPTLGGPGRDPYGRAGDGALSPSFSGDGYTLAFSSTADNFVYGDGNTPPVGDTTYDGSDAFLVKRVLFSSTEPQQYISAPPPAPALIPTWRLFTTVQSRRDGTVLLRVRVPAAGLLRAVARGSLLVKGGAGASAHRSSRRMQIATVATRKAGVLSAGTVDVVLRLSARYAALARRGGGFAASVALVFSAAGHGSLREHLEVTFKRHALRLHAPAWRNGRRR